MVITLLQAIVALVSAIDGKHLGSSWSLVFRMLDAVTQIAGVSTLTLAEKAQVLRLASPDCYPMGCGTARSGGGLSRHIHLAGLVAAFAAAGVHLQVEA